MADVASNEILATVAEELKKNGNDRVMNMVADLLVNSELDKRAQALKKCMDLLSQETKNLAKLRPDLVTYDVHGKETSQNYTKKQIDERAKVQKRIDKLTGAINKALNEEKPDFSDVYNLQNGKLEDDTAGKTDGAGKQQGDE